MRQKQLIRIELPRGTGGSVYVSMSPSECVLNIKHKLETLTGIPILSQTLYQAASPLPNSTLLNEFCNSDPFTNLSLHIRIRGGAGCRPTNNYDVIHCPDISNKDSFIHGKLVPGPDYRGVKYGLNIEATCKNKKCASVKLSQNVMIRKGTFETTGGKCSIRKEIFNMTCPACLQKIPSREWKNFVFRGCTAKIDWMLSDEETSGSTNLEVNEDDYAMAKHGEGLKKYAYIEVLITVKK